MAQCDLALIQKRMWQLLHGADHAAPALMCKTEIEQIIVIILLLANQFLQEIGNAKVRALKELLCALF